MTFDHSKYFHLITHGGTFSQVFSGEYIEERKQNLWKCALVDEHHLLNSKRSVSQLFHKKIYVKIIPLILMMLLFACTGAGA